MLDARVEAAKLLELYKDDPRQRKFNLLLMGEKGVGKTSLVRTARKPVHIDSFDPGGTIVLQDMIYSGDVVADTRYENEDPKSPKAYRLWMHTFMEKYKDNYFESFGTYVIDTTTPWIDSMLYWVQHTIEQGKSHAGETPKWNRDYRPVRTEVENQLRLILNLPCDVILIGHYTGDYEDVLVYNPVTQMRERESNLFRYVFNGIGETKNKVPLFFTEMWILQFGRETRDGTERRVLTQNDGLFRASTRLGASGKFNKWEEPNIKNLLKKAGWPTADKPSLFHNSEKGKAK